MSVLRLWEAHNLKTKYSNCHISVTLILHYLLKPYPNPNPHRGPLKLLAEREREREREREGGREGGELGLGRLLKHDFAEPDAVAEGGGTNPRSRCGFISNMPPLPTMPRMLIDPCNYAMPLISLPLIYAHT